MTKLLDQAFAAARRLSHAQQDDIAQVVLQLTDCDELPPIPLTAEEQDAIAASKAAAARGDFAAAAEVRAVWKKHGL